MDAQAHLGSDLKSVGERFQLSHGGHEALPGQGFQIRLYRMWRVPEAGAHLPDGAAEEPRRKAHLVAEKFVGMLGLDAKGLKGQVGKILEILRDDHIAAPRDGGGEDVAIPWIGKHNVGISPS